MLAMMILYQTNARYVYDNNKQNNEEYNVVSRLDADIWSESNVNKVELTHIGI